MTLRMALVLAAALAGCAGPAKQAESLAWRQLLEELGWRPAAAVESIPQFRIDGYRVLDASHLLLHTGSGRSHLASLATPCPGLASAERIGYSTSGGALTRLDKLYVVDRLRVDVPCMIESLHALERLAPPR